MCDVRKINYLAVLLATGTIHCNVFSMEDLVWMIGTYMQIYKNDAPGWIVTSVVYIIYTDSIEIPLDTLSKFAVAFGEQT